MNALREELADALGNQIYVCTRVWKAWRLGTMTQDDFHLACDDEDVLDSLEAIYPGWQPIETAPKNKAIILYAPACKIGDLPALGVPTNSRWPQAIAFGGWDDDEEKWSSLDDEWTEDHIATHWMPFPNPPL